MRRLWVTTILLSILSGLCFAETPRKIHVEPIVQAGQAGDSIANSQDNPEQHRLPLDIIVWKNVNGFETLVSEYRHEYPGSNQWQATLDFLNLDEHRCLKHWIQQLIKDLKSADVQRAERTGLVGNKPRFTYTVEFINSALDEDVYQCGGYAIKLRVTAFLDHHDSQIDVPGDALAGVYEVPKSYIVKDDTGFGVLKKSELLHVIQEAKRDWHDEIANYRRSSDPEIQTAVGPKRNDLP